MEWPRTGAVVFAGSFWVHVMFAESGPFFHSKDVSTNQLDPCVDSLKFGAYIPLHSPLISLYPLRTPFKGP